MTADRMKASFGNAPHFYLDVEVQADALLEMRDHLLPAVERKAGVRLTITDLLVRITGAALAEHPRANAFWTDGRIGLHERVNLGIAVATSDSAQPSTHTGLVVPVLRDVDRKPLAQIAAERAALVTRARTGQLSPDDLAGGTFTLTNLGMYRVDSFHAILNPPQSAILAVGRIAERPVAIAGQLAVRRTVVLTLSCDHRVLDGVLGALFLGRVAELIEDPYELLV
jgi:pyruvate dehydrogenase E2 component (dihydrolipoamide acetyltransferase)